MGAAASLKLVYFDAMTWFKAVSLVLGTVASTCNKLINTTTFNLYSIY